MSHSQLIILREDIQKIRDERLLDSMSECQIILDKIRDHSKVVDDSFVSTAQDGIDKTIYDIATTNAVLDGYLADIDSAIRDETFDFIREDAIHYKRPGVIYKSADYNREYQQLKMSDDTLKTIRARIGIYTDWRFPGLEIGPGDGEWTKWLVACDPLYVVDHNDEFLITTKAKFNKAYQNRLRCYLNSSNGLYMLPQNQFGFVFSWNTFNYFSFDQINKYLKEIHNVLRPGGACMFSYNNAELAICAQRSENHIMSFIPEQILRKVIKNAGFTDIKTINMDTSVSWIEFRKPGELSSNRTGQTLGKIILKHHVKA